ncbi:MAG TPA: type III pantothenate kinase [Rhodocyclaceae bacterium]|nr:type III pantothenate kinase [Rhodocyclaceae bacterium]
MILCIDCGNTRIKWGLLTPKGLWQAHGVMPLAQLDNLRAALIDQPAFKRVVACNVSGAENGERIAAQIKVTPEWVVPQREQCGVKNGYKKAAQLGADRWASLIAARAMHSGACLVVNAGTATTIDLLGADGRFRGGVILPGLNLMRKALAHNTADLPLADAAHQAIPTDTDSAIVSGALEASAGAIERMFARLEDPTATCLLSGGAAAAIAPLLQIPVQSIDDLVLRGLACIALSDNRS